MYKWRLVLDGAVIRTFTVVVIMYLLWGLEWQDSMILLLSSSVRTTTFHALSEQLADFADTLLVLTAGRVVQHPMLQAKVVDALTANSATLVLRRTGWISTVRRIVIQVIVLHLSQSHLSTLRTTGAFSSCAGTSCIAHLKAGCGPGGRDTPS